MKYSGNYELFRKEISFMLKLAIYYYIFIFKYVYYLNIILLLI